jgi:cadmium resistance protein CadD (predicted permease)
MEGLAGTILTAAGLFAITNIDGLIVLTALFLASASGKPRPWQIVAGQYLGFSAMLILSGLAAFGLIAVPDQAKGLVGLLPLALGIRGLLKARTNRSGASPWITTNLPSVAAVILANGLDNISVYTTLFSRLSIGGIVTTVAVFLVLGAVWCYLAFLFGGNKKIVVALSHAGDWLVPLVFIAIGATILITSGVPAELHTLFAEGTGSSSTHP